MGGACNGRRTDASRSVRPRQIVTRRYELTYRVDILAQPPVAAPELTIQAAKVSNKRPSTPAASANKTAAASGALTTKFRSTSYKVRQTETETTSPGHEKEHHKGWQLVFRWALPASLVPTAPLLTLNIHKHDNTV